MKASILGSPRRLHGCNTTPSVRSAFAQVRLSGFCSGVGTSMASHSSAGVQPDRFPALTKQIDDMYLRLKPSQEQIDERDDFLLRLQRSVDRVVEGAVVLPFGSAVNGFWSPNSDIDVCIQLAGCRRRADQINALRKVANALHSISSHFIEPRFGARVPIIHWAPRRPGYLACDISINNNLAVMNSRLVGAYCDIDPRMRRLGMAIKFWAKARGINDRSRGTLSSFSLLLMLISFLQKRNPPILPSLQDLALELNEPLMYLDGSDIRFMTDRIAIAEEMNRITNGVSNEEPLGELFHEFFNHYGFQYKQGIIGIRDLRSFEIATPSPDRSLYLNVDNPFEVGKDVANVSPSQHARIRQEFRRAKSCIENNNTLDEICAVVKIPTVGSRTGSHPLDPPRQILGKK
jgi:DNA polymerase sigma